MEWDQRPGLHWLEYLGRLNHSQQWQKKLNKISNVSFTVHIHQHISIITAVTGGVADYQASSRHHHDDIPPCVQTGVLTWMLLLL